MWLVFLILCLILRVKRYEQHDQCYSIKIIASIRESFLSRYMIIDPILSLEWAFTL